MSDLLFAALIVSSCVNAFLIFAIYSTKRKMELREKQFKDIRLKLGKQLAEAKKELEK